MIIRCEQEGLRIDVFLSEQVEALSRSGAGQLAESRSKRIIRPMRETRSPLHCRSRSRWSFCRKIFRWIFGMKTRT